MKVIGHQQVVADQPGLGFPPNLYQKPMHCRLRDPGRPVFRVNRQEHDGWLAPI
jgi:hypothetical protein